MAITDYTVRVKSNFICATQDDAGARRKRDNTHTPLPWARTSYVRLEAFMGTHKDAINRTAAHAYGGHVPEAPCMLGSAGETDYAAAAKDTGWGRLRLSAMGKASVLVGLAVTAAAAVPVLAAVLAAKFGLLAALPGEGIVNFLCAAYLTGAVGGAVYEGHWYARAKNKFVALANLDAGFRQLRQGLLDEQSVAKCEAIVAKSFEATDWALRQAALEYEAELVHRRAEKNDEAEKIAAAKAAA